VLNPIQYIKIINRCEGDSAMIDSIWYSEPVIFYDTINSASGCDSAILVTQLEIIDNTLDIQVDPPSPALIDPGSSLQLHVYANTVFPRIKWSPSEYLNCDTCWNPFASPPGDITYRVVVSDSINCRDEDSVQLRINTIEPNNPDCYRSIYVPNAFTPNGDGINDVFYVYGNGIEELHFIIANRWGEVVFESYDLNSGWDGIYRGEQVVPDVYVYYVEAKFCDGTKLKYTHPYRKGSVTLIR
jgi:gliding motility-associated-like protein